MVTARKAKLQDVEQVLKLIKAFQTESLDDYKLFCDDETARKNMPKYVDTTLVLEDEGVIVGVISGIIGTMFLYPGQIYHELVWYVEKKYRRYGLKLFNELEKFCIERQIKHIIMAAMGNCKNRELEIFYSSRGYRHLETHYIKNL